MSDNQPTLADLETAIRANVVEAKRIEKEAKETFQIAITTLRAIKTGNHPLRVERGRLLHQARPQFDSKKDFGEWCRRATNRSVSDAYACMKLAGADDPEAAAEAEKANATERKRSQRQRGKEQSVTSPGVTDKPGERPYVPPQPSWAGAPLAVKMSDFDPIGSAEPVCPVRIEDAPPYEGTPEYRAAVEALQKVTKRGERQLILNLVREWWSWSEPEPAEPIAEAEMPADPKPVEADPAFAAMIEKIKSAGTPWVGPTNREKLGIDEDMVDDMIAAGVLRQHPKQPNSVGLAQ